MRLYAPLILILTSISSVYAVLADEAYQVDHHQALIGIPQPENTFFHRPSTSSNASLLYTISDKAILGAVNPKDGSLVWRQRLATQLPLDGAKLYNEEQLGAFHSTGTAKSGLLAEDGSGFVVSYYGSTVFAWDAKNGRQIWQREMPEDQHIKDALLLSSQHDAESASVIDIVVLYGNDTATVAKLDGSSGVIIWQHKGPNGAPPRFLASSGDEVYHGAEQSAVIGAKHIKVTSLAADNGQEGSSYNIKADDILQSASCSALALISWYDKPSRSMKVNILGSSKIHTLALENSSDEVEGVALLPLCGSKSSLDFLVHVKTTTGAWAEVFHIASQKGEITKVYSLPYLEEKDAITISHVDGRGFITRITDLEIELYSLDSNKVLARWSRKHPSFGGPNHAQAEVVVRGPSDFAIRIAETSRDGEWTLMRNNELIWSRPEVLANVVAAAWADDLSGEGLAHVLDLEGHENPLRAYVHRVKRHWRDLQAFPAWLQQLPSNIMSGLVSSKTEAEKGLLGSKFLIVATSSGQYLALDPTKSGAIKWKKVSEASAGGEQRAVSLYVQDGILTSYVDNGGIITLNATTGQTISHERSNDYLTTVAITPGPVAPVAYRILRDGQPEPTSPDDVAKDGTYLVTLPTHRSHVQGWMIGRSKHQLWTFSRGDGYRVVSVVGRPSHDPVSSIGKVLGDRSVLYKYLSQNLIVITSTTANTVAIDLVDAITGTVLYSVSHQNVDIRSPIPTTISENWFAYSFFGNESPPTSPSKSHQLVIVELYESSLPNDRGPLGAATNYSSFHPPPGSTYPPHVITQSFILATPISHMSVTQTAQGITSRQLLCTLPALHAIVAIPRHILDPRRPVERDPTPAEAAEEGLFRYSPVLELDAKFFLSHAREVMGVHRLMSSPSLLESTSWVFGFGLDVFVTRVSPSKAFDVLGKGFNKIALLGTVVALAVGTAGLAPLVRSRMVERGWRM